MKGWKWFVVVSSLIGIPVLLVNLLKRLEAEDQNRRYNIDDFVGEELR